MLGTDHWRLCPCPLASAKGRCRVAELVAPLLLKADQQGFFAISTLAPTKLKELTAITSLPVL